MTTIPDHLGGFGTDPDVGDAATWYPDLWAWLVRQRGVSSVLDIGCGTGVSTRFFSGLGADAIGIDGVEVEYAAHLLHDFTRSGLGFDRRFDLGWCCEFLEHIEEQFLPNVAPALQACDTILMTHAFPGQGGHHHVNCREPQYWANWFGLLGYRLDEQLTASSRAIAMMNRSPWNHYVRSGMAFVHAGHESTR